MYKKLEYRNRGNTETKRGMRKMARNKEEG